MGIDIDDFIGKDGEQGLGASYVHDSQGQGMGIKDPNFRGLDPSGVHPYIPNGYTI
jgi:hypothetical protein